MIERTVELAKFRVDGRGDRHQPPAPWRGLRVDYTSTLPAHDLRRRPAQRHGAAGRGRHRGRDRLARRQGRAQAGPDHHAGRRPGRPNPRDFAAAVAELKRPVSLETDLGAVTLK